MCMCIYIHEILDYQVSKFNYYKLSLVSTSSFAIFNGTTKEYEILLGMGLGIAGIALSWWFPHANYILQWRGNKIALVKKDPYSYNDYNSLRSDL